MDTKRSSNNKSYKSLLKTWFSNLYMEKLQIDYYHFIQQYNNHFEIAQAIRTNRTWFVATFFYRSSAFIRQSIKDVIELLAKFLSPG